MKRINKSIISILITFGIGVSAWLFFNSSYFETTKFDIPESRWEKLFFKGIDKTTELAKLPKLREKNLSASDIEIRIWEGFGLEDLEGIILTRTDKIWRAFYIKNNHYAEPTKTHYTSLYNVPKSGWKSFTNEIFEAGILTLPDSISIGCEVRSLDGRSYVVEVYKDKTYRTYRYNSLSKNKCEEGTKMIRIAKLVAKEFHNGVKNCGSNRWLSCSNMYEE